MICLEIEKRRRKQKTQTNPKPTPIQPKTPKPQAQPSTQPAPLLSLGRFNFLRGPVPHPARSPASAGLPPVAAQAPPLSLGPACTTTRPQDPGPLASRGPLTPLRARPDHARSRVPVTDRPVPPCQFLLPRPRNRRARNLRRDLAGFPPRRARLGSPSRPTNSALRLPASPPIRATTPNHSRAATTSLRNAEDLRRRGPAAPPCPSPTGAAPELRPDARKFLEVPAHDLSRCSGRI